MHFRATHTTALILLLLSACSTSPSSPTMPPAEPPRPAKLGEVERSGVLSGMHTVTLKTSKGDIELLLDANAAPKTVTNFVALAKRGYYDNLTFHRVIDDFMIQGGDPLGTGAGGESIYGSDFEDEINSLPMVRGAIAMANRGPNTNGSQFFIIQAASTPWLEGKHTVFGKVTKGIEVPDAIAKVPTGAGGKPLEPVTFTVEVVD